MSNDASINLRSMAQLGNAARRRIAVIPAFPSGFNHLLDDVTWRRLVRITHAKVDDVFALMARFQFKALNLGKHVGGEPLKPIKII